MKNQKGITLIALIITIVVMLLLVVVTISAVMGKNGVLTQAKQAKLAHSNSEEKEKVALAISNAKTAHLTSLNGEQAFNKELIQESIEQEFGVNSCNVTEEAGSFIVTINETNNKYKVSRDGKVEGPITEETSEEDAALGEYYLRMVNIIEDFIDGTDEDWEEIYKVWEELEKEGKISMVYVNTGIENYETYYYIIDGYIIATVSEYHGKEEDGYAYIVSKDDPDYTKVLAMSTETFEILTKLQTLFLGYTYTKDINYEELEIYIENSLGKDILFHTKSNAEWYLKIPSEYDENTFYSCYIDSQLNEDYSYTVYYISVD